MIYILHIDTSSTVGLVILALDGEIVSSRLNMTERDHANSINKMISDVLEEGEIELNQLHAIAVCSGPGSYTGLRIGMATAKGLCYALDKPLITNTKLELIVDEANNQKVLNVAILPARIGEYFVAAYQGGNVVIAPTHMNVKDLESKLNDFSEYVIVGNVGEDLGLLQAVKLVHDDSILQPQWATLTFNSYKQNNFANIAFAEPLYLKQVFIHGK